MKTESEIEDAILAVVESFPGISTRKLAGRVGRRTETVLRAIDALVRTGRLERRTEGMGNAFYVPQEAFPTVEAELLEELSMVAGESPAQRASEPRETLTPPAALDPGVCPACKTRKLHPALSPECVDRSEIRMWLAEINYPHVPIDQGAGRSIPAGKLAADFWLDRCTLAERTNALRTLRDPIMRHVLTFKVPA